MGQRHLNNNYWRLFWLSIRLIESLKTDFLFQTLHLQFYASLGPLFGALKTDFKAGLAPLLNCIFKTCVNMFSNKIFY